ncbi:hypothetical protein DERP_009379 [Dermatophagoides pteronyssinus]|uniref:SURP motif domain-containing protein n=1 Tax=Dermatophagoides pteronyssinus TaxID=6956 RepID=A0ABQ8ITN0_DERPT|nr:hypothetical protein DERP_009379 [Dermatophagoides pteronyssinus]
MENENIQWNRNRLKHQKHSNDQNDDQLFIFGYQCKLYRDDEKSRWINNGKHLIPWIGDHNILIDRYDVRGYLHDLSDLNDRQTLVRSNDDEKFEMELNRERFRFLCDEENQTDDKKTGKETKGEYSNVGFSYDSNTGDGKSDDNDHQNHNGDGDEDNDNDYQIPNGLTVPDNMQLPTSMKLHQIIAKTASFVATQGLQMEILLKTKQAANSNFEFLSIDSNLHPYYKHLLIELKSGRYRFDDSNEQQSKSNNNDTNDNNNDDDDDDDDDDNYLHPSLLAKTTTTTQTMEKVQIPSLFIQNYNNEQELAYSKLLYKIRLLANATSNKCPLIPKPSADIELIIDKLAEHVAQNGENFETSIRELNNPKFDFLNNGHRFNAHYVQRKIHFIARQKQKERMEKQHQSRLEKSSSPSTSSITFSMTGKKKEDSKKSRLVVVTDDHVRKNLTNETNNDDGDQSHNDDLLESKQVVKNVSAQEKRLQEFRKRKAQEFLKFLRNQNRLADNPVTFGPNLPSTANVELSPTIERVTSPLPQMRDSSDSDECDQNPVVDKTKSSIKTDQSPLRNYDIVIDDCSPPKRYRSSDDDDDENRRRRRSRSRSFSLDRRHKHSSRHKSRHHSKHSRKKSRSRSKSHDYHRSSHHHHHHRSSNKSKRNHYRSSSQKSSSLSSRSRSRSRSKSRSRSRRHYHR